MATQTQQNGQDKTYDFAPVDYDASTVPPRIGAGRYEAAAACSARPTNADKLPMLVIEWTAEAVADGNEDNEQFVGQSISDFLVLSDDAKFRGHKLRLRTMLERMGLSFDLVPRRIENKGDLEELISAVSGQKLVVTVVHKMDKNNEQRENVDYREPRGEATDGGEVDAAPVRGGAARKPVPAKKPAAKSSRR
jgi:hypothetical protein